MPAYCSARGCTNKSNKAYCKENKISFHRFPFKDENRLKTWFTSMKQENIRKAEHAYLCSEHFIEEDFEHQSFTNRRQLKRTAVPSRFSFMEPIPKRHKTSLDLGFPKDEILRNKQNVAVGELSFQCSKCRCQCSEHFAEGQIDHTPLPCVLLGESVVPNIFEKQPEHQKKLKHRRRGMKRKLASKKDEDSLSDMGLNEIKTTIPNSSDNGQIESSDLSDEELCASQSSNDENKSAYSHHPNILRVIPADKMENTPSSKFLSSHSLNPNLLDALSTCHQIGKSLVTDGKCSSTTPIIVVQSCSLPATADSSVETDFQEELRHYKTMNENYRTKIKILRQETRRQQAKIESLKRQMKAQRLESIQSSDEDVSEDCISESEIYEELLKYQRENNGDSDS